MICPSVSLASGLLRQTSKTDLLFRILYPHIIHHVLLIPSLFISTSSSCLKPVPVLFWVGPKASHIMGLLQTGPPPTQCFVTPTAPPQTLLTPTCPSEPNLTSPTQSMGFVPLCSRCSECPWAFDIPPHCDLLPSIYQHVLSTSLDTAVCLASWWCQLEVPSSSYLPGSTLSLMTNGY